MLLYSGGDTKGLETLRSVQDTGRTGLTCEVHFLHQILLVFSLPNTKATAKYIFESHDATFEIILQILTALKKKLI